VTELLFLVDSYTREFQAHVTELADDGVVLDRTAFYAGGGGQPCDTGVLVAGEARFQVTRVGRKDGKIVHQIQGDEAKIAFNSRYLQEVLSVLERGKVALETTSPSSPGVFKPTDSDDYVHVVMPMFVQW